MQANIKSKNYANKNKQIISTQKRYYNHKDPIN